MLILCDISLFTLNIWILIFSPIRLGKNTQVLLDWMEAVKEQPLNFKSFYHIHLAWDTFYILYLYINIVPTQLFPFNTNFLIHFNILLKMIQDCSKFLIGALRQLKSCSLYVAELRAHVPHNKKNNFFLVVFAHDDTVHFTFVWRMMSV